MLFSVCTQLDILLCSGSTLFEFGEVYVESSWLGYAAAARSSRLFDACLLCERLCQTSQMQIQHSHVSVTTCTWSHITKRQMPQ